MATGRPANADLGSVDSALLRLRRLWTAPRAFGRVSEGSSSAVGCPVDVSTVLVLEAVLHTAPTDHSGGVTVTDVAQRLDVASSTASRLVDRAVRAGVVARRQDDADGRRTVVVATREGHVLHAQAHEFRLRYLRALLADWDEREVAAFAAALERFAQAVEANPNPTELARCQPVDANQRTPGASS
jgi:DNA-binding MarR family transcriptional regulator